MTAILGFFGGVWGKIAAAGGVVLGIILALVGLRKSGVKEGQLKEKAKAQEAAIKAVKDRQEVEDEVDSLADADVRERLRRFERPD